ncbi:hypothetical protein WEI85_35505 [Actinomycetes bacterium KLBMP 9797]
MSVISRGRAAALATLAAAALAGCSADDPSPPADPGDRLVVTPPSVSAIPRLDTVRGLTLPTDAYRPSAEELSLVAAAEHKLVAECMSRYGFTWPAPPAERAETHQVDRLYGVADLATAQRYGYHLPPSGNSRDKPAGRSGGGQPLSRAELLALDGPDGGDGARSHQGKEVPEGGCAGAARQQVTGASGDTIDPTRVADAITVEMWQKSKSDPRVVAVVAAWSACMTQAGYDYPSPLQVSDARWSVTGAITAVEIRTAVADVRCKQRTNLIGVWFTIESGYERQAVQQQIERLTGIRSKWTDAARNAARILGRTAPS